MLFDNPGAKIVTQERADTVAKQLQEQNIPFWYTILLGDARYLCFEPQGHQAIAVWTLRSGAEAFLPLATKMALTVRIIPMPYDCMDLDHVIDVSISDFAKGSGGIPPEMVRKVEPVSDDLN